jgi:AraC-like DNA-binding protein
MRVYHGSYTEVSEIDLTKGRSSLDYGKGFYVTGIRSQAEYWATRSGRFHKTDGVVSEFEFYENAFDHFELKVLRFSSYTEQWLDFVVLNRNPKSPIPAHDYDIIEGPVANDDVNNRINDFLAGIVSKADFLTELSHHKPTRQICFCTVRSLQMIEPIDKKHYITVKHISRPIIEKLITEQHIYKYDAADIFYNSKTFSRLSDKTTGFHKKHWMDIYDMLKTELNLQ